MTDSPCLLLIASSLQERTPAFERAIALAKASGVGLRIVVVDYVNTLEVMGYFNPDALSTLREEYLHDHRRWLESQIEKERGGGLDVSMQLMWLGDVYHDVHDYVRAIAPIMVIKDIHHEPSLKRLFSRPLDWHLLRQCLCPIQFVTSTSQRLPRKILAAVNLYRSNDAELWLNDTLLDAASRLAAQCLAILHVVYVYDWAAIYAAGANTFGAQPVENGFQEALSDAHEEAFALLCAHHGIAGNSCHFLNGSPRTTLETFARQHDFDLLVMGTQPVHGLEKIMGDTAENLLTHAPCSVLVVKAGTLRIAG
ncbi:universal stress protein [Pseudomonas huanghezhanensis]|uniref:universal stress protein n=1 Tax=Pseudomonas huanghezhanensis TaxID=3002903 RepID=UPI0022867E62|nr:universal stress protein [Pseudomonas sp. BSw22131]